LLRIDYDATESRDVIDDVTNRRSVGTFLCGSLLDMNPINLLVSEIFSIKVADTQTDVTHAD